MSQTKCNHLDDYDKCTIFAPVPTGKVKFTSLQTAQFEGDCKFRLEPDMRGVDCDSLQLDAKIYYEDDVKLANIEKINLLKAKLIQSIGEQCNEMIESIKEPS